MKMQTTKLFSQLSEENLHELTAETTELLAMEFKKDHKVFSTADLWNIQRRQKPRMYRRYV